MTWLLLLLIVAYVLIALFARRLSVRMPLYFALIIHVSLLGWLMSSISWVDPKVGLVGVSWLLMAGIIWFINSPKIRSLVPALVASTAFMLTMALLAPSSISSIDDVQLWISIHLLLILIGYLGCVLGGVLGGSYIFVSAKLKSRNLKEIRRYPTLTTIAKYNFLSIGYGTIGLLAGIVMGVFWALSVDQFRWDVTWVMSFLMLGWYSIGLVGHLMGKQARWNAWFSVVGLGLLSVFFVFTSLIGSWHLGVLG